MFNTNIKSLPIPYDILGREDLTLSEKVVYSFLRYRYNLSSNNPKFQDEQGTFIFFEQKDIMVAAAMAQRTVENAMKKLKEIGLIDRIKHRRTFKIYLKPYEVDERFIIADKAAEDVQDAPNESTPNVTPQETENPLEGQNNANLHNVDKSVDNMWINNDNESSIHAKNTPIDSEIHAKNASKNNIYIYNNTIDNNNNKNNFTLLKGHAPKVTIDYDLYTMFSKCFNKKPNVLVKREINRLLATGIEKDLIIELMERAGMNTWSWAYVTKELSKLSIDGIKTLNELFNKELEAEGIEVSPLTDEQLKAREASMNKFMLLSNHPSAEPSEWNGIDQLVLVQ